METLEQQLSSLSPEQRRLVGLWLRHGKAAEAAPPGDTRIPRRRPTDPAPLSFAQQRLWFLNQLDPASAAYNLRTAVRLQGILDAAMLARSLNAIVQRHESLRTTFVAVDGQPQQAIAPALVLPLPLEDLTDVPPETRDAAVERLALAETEQPFDLAGGPLLRARLVRLRPDDHVLLLAMHHAISDGWSQGIQVRELATFYAAFAQGQPDPLPPLPIQYADYAAWQRTWLQGQPLQQQLAYWKAQLGPGNHVLELPTDQPRPAVATGRGAWEYFTIPAALLDQLHALSRGEGVTLFMTLLAAFNVLLARLSGQTDIVVGMPMAGRTRSELEDLIGCFVNMLALRTDLCGNPSFRTLLQQVRGVTLGAYAHQDLPFEKLVEELELTRDLSRNPIFQVMFVLQNMPMPALRGPGLTLVPMEVHSTTATLDLALYLREMAAGLLIRVEYSTDLFTAATIHRLLGQYQRLLEGIIADPAMRIADLPLLAPAERHQILVEWNATAIDYPQDITLAQLFIAQVERTPERVAFICEDAHATYRALNQRANKLAHALRERGVGMEVRVGVCLERSVDLVVALLAILKAGGTYVPLDPSYPPERLTFMLEASQATVLITQKEIRDWRLEIKSSEQSLISNLQSPSLIHLDQDWPQIAQDRDDNPAVPQSPEQASYIIFTSGSTGRPKGVMLSQRHLLNRFAWMWREHPFGADDVGCQKATVNFADSLWELLGPSLQGTPVLIIPDEAARDPQELVAGLARANVTQLWVVPSLLRTLLDICPDLAARLPRLALWVSSGEALTLDLARRFYERLPGRRLINLYGTSEAFDATVVEITREHLSGVRIPIGRPLDNVQAYVLDHYLNPVPPGVNGELYVGGVSLARGYLGRPDLTAERFIPNPFERLEIRDWRLSNTESSISNLQSLISMGTRLYKTGDLARYRPDGTIEYLGRADHQVKVRGVRIEPGEIEAALRRHPAVRACVVVARPDAQGALRLVAYLTQEPRTKNQEPEDSEEGSQFSVLGSEEDSGSQFSVLGSGELRTYLASQLPEYMIPAVFVVLDALPLTPSGKVNRQALPAPDYARSDEVAYVAPTSPAEVILARVWGEVLGCPQIGTNDNFFTLGGDSLLAARMVAYAQREGLHVTLKQLFAHQTIAQLAATTAVEPEEAPTEQGPISGPLPLAIDQGWFFSQDFMDPRHRFNVSWMLLVRPGLDARILEQAAGQLLRHHDALRSRFAQDAGRWHARIMPPGEDTPFVYIDLAAVADADLRAAIEQASEALQSRINLIEGPLVQFIYFDCGAGRPGRLLLIAHHLVADGYSGLILVEDLHLGYQQLARGEQMRLLSKTTSIKEWAERINAHVRSPAMRAELEYWYQRPWEAVPHLPLDFPDGRARMTRGSCRVAEGAIGPEETQALLRLLPRIDQAAIPDALVLALVETITRWTGGRWIEINLVDAGRGSLPLGDQFDLSRTVGWLATSGILILERPAAATPVAALRAMLAQLRAIPMRGIGYHMLRFLSPDPEAVRRLVPLRKDEVHFNYFGQVDYTFPADSIVLGPATEQGGGLSQPDDPIFSLLDGIVLIVQNRLIVRWTYSTEVYRPETIEGLVEHFVGVLRALAAELQGLDQ